MSYFLKKSTPSKKGLYLQIYQTFYVPKKGKRNKSYKALGYVSELKDSGVEDPIAWAQSQIDELNEREAKRPVPKIGSVSVQKNVGYFLLKSMMDYLGIDGDLRIMTQNRKFQYDFPGFLRAMIYAQVVNPGSKHKAFEEVIPTLYGVDSFSYDQILDGVNFIGQDYKKFVELFNAKITKRYKRDTSTAYFDCTNYYFEIDLPSEDRQKGPSKENRKSPIISQALMLDRDQIPIAMSMFPGNESEKPELGKAIEDIKTRYDISSKIVQVADKGLNCAKNIYAAVREANDGYLFSKSVHGHYLSETEKEWILLDNDQNQWTEVKGKNGKTVYKYKEAVGDYSYKFRDDDGNIQTFTVREKRVVTYNYTLARKQTAEIEKEVDKAKRVSSYKEAHKEDYGDSIKYVIFERDGKKVKGDAVLNEKKIKEDKMFAGYNLLVTSELGMSAREIYDMYHGLWRIEESFRVMKTYLEARPTYVRDRYSIYGHFTICYLALTVLRLLELKVFDEEIPVGQIVKFMRDYSVTETSEGEYINAATKSSMVDKIREVFGISKLDNLYLKKKDIKNFLSAEIPEP